jgi:hypothetical protein
MVLGARATPENLISRKFLKFPVGVSLISDYTSEHSLGRRRTEPIMHKRRTPVTDYISEMLAFYKEASDRQKPTRADPALQRQAPQSLVVSKHLSAPLGAALRTRKHRRRHCVGAA